MAINNTTLQIKFRQRLNKLASNDYDNIEYFDMTEYVINDDILIDQYHFNEKGTNILSNYILDWIDSKS